MTALHRSARHFHQPASEIAQLFAVALGHASVPAALLLTRPPELGANACESHPAEAALFQTGARDQPLKVAEGKTAVAARRPVDLEAAAVGPAPECGFVDPEDFTSPAEGDPPGRSGQRRRILVDCGVHYKGS